jgi:tripeptide aminopeptidase
MNTGYNAELNVDRLLASFLEMVQVDSLSLKEAAIAQIVASALIEAGCEVHIDGAGAGLGSDTGNLIARMPASPGRAGRLFLSAHLDTVEPGVNIQPTIIDGVLSSVGDTILGGDDKVGLAAIVEMARIVQEQSLPHAEVVILLSIAEEIGLKGAMALDGEALGFAGEPCFVLDADGPPGSVIIGAPFQVEYTARFIGKAAHAGVSPEVGVSAITAAAKAVASMPQGRIDQMTTANVGTIQGGNANNIVADRCTITGEMRSLEQARLEQVKAEVEACIEAAAAEAGAQVESEFRQTFAGFRLDADDPLVTQVLGFAADLGLTPETRYTGGGSDANIYAGKGLVPMVLGTGMTAVHSPAESLAITDMVDLARLTIAIVTGYQPVA